MERLLRERDLYSQSFDRDYEEIQQEIQTAQPDLMEIQGSMKMLTGTFEVLNDINRKILNLMLDDEIYDDQIATAKAEADKIAKKYHKLQCKLEFRINKDNSDTQSSIGSNKRRLRLPKIELQKFGGDIKDWLSFWSSFRRIHEDDEIENEDKFQFLIQAITPKSKAIQLIESYPTTAGNYNKAIDSLKSRFGREDLLTEFYIRELLKLVLNNLQNKNKLNFLYDKMITHLRALETLGVTTENCAAILYPLVESCLPEEVLRVWQRSDVFSTSSPLQFRLEHLMQFLKKEVENEERIVLATGGFELNRQKKTEKYSEETIPTAAGLFAQNKMRSKPKCIFCKEGHFNDTCPKASQMQYIERKKIASSRGCCHACLKFGHLMRKCRSAMKLKCDKCGGQHVTLMCSNGEEKNAVNLPKNETLSNQTYSHIFLQTLSVDLTSENQRRRIRALIDTGSQRSYVLKQTAEEMKYELLKEEEMVHGLFGGTFSEPVSHKLFKVCAKSIDNSYGCTFEALDQNVICGNVSCVSNGPWMEELNEMGIVLSDIKDGEIELLIGADIIGKLLTGKRHVLNCGLVALETKLGWTMIGKFTKNDQSLSSLSVMSLLNQNSRLSDLWNLEVLGILDPVAEKNRKEIEEAVQKQFLETVTRTEDGRYEVSLPWIENHPPLPNNYHLAQKRLKSLMKRFEKDGFYEDYNQVFKEWLAEGIIEVVTEADRNYGGHYLSHHCVVKLSSTTTKIRPVFNASAKTNAESPSLNDCLEKGINLIELIPSVIIGFRLRKFGVISDVRKAFLQISLNVNDRNFLKFLWFDEEKEVVTYRHARVVFGVTSSPFLLGAVINYHLNNMPKESSNLEDTNQRLLHSFYVHNCITSFDYEEDLQNFITESTKIMKNAKFDLRLWEYTRTAEEDEEENVSACVLGLRWNKNRDTLNLSLENIEEDKITKCTKRNILSAANKIFDPIGFACPYLLIPKMLLQKLCLLKLSWNAEAPEEIAQHFFEWLSQLTDLRKLAIPRWLLQEVNPKQENISLHLFCDASQQAYAAVIVLRVQSPTGNTAQVQLIQAKSRVAPGKKISICRLELLAATIGARLLDGVTKVFGDRYKDSTYCWTDSTTVLSWIKRADNWKPFVRNRVQEIRMLTRSEAWYYVPGEQNPADLPSRGSSVNRLIREKWWEGPMWLQKSLQDWPEQNYRVNEEIVGSEKQKNVIGLVIKDEDFSWLYERFSNYQNIINMVAWMKRFMFNCKNHKKRFQGPLDLEEIESAENIVIRLVQSKIVSELNTNKLGSLLTFVDSTGTMRVKTKISEREDFENFKYPFLLPSKHPVVRRLIFDEHVKHCHAGVQTLLSLLREKFWIVNGRKTIRSVVSNCMRCRRIESRSLEPIPIALPNDRVRDAAVFEVCGTDLAGPLFLKDKSKVWICIFTCAIYRAVHLELVNSLTTDSFIQALKRFISRRGRPNILYSDNGTNFLGTENALTSIDWNEIKKVSTVERIKWRFNPPTAAWWGGWWERMIKILKILLKKSLGKAAVTQEELSTLLCECEAVVNSRPITYISEDPRDIVSLTPAMFLQDIKEVGVPDLDKVEANDLRRRVRYRLRLKQNLRTRFRNEYLGQLILKKQRSSEYRVKIGDMVLIGSDNKKRLDWPLARIQEVFHGKDGKVRLLKLKTTNGTILRPIQRVYPMEILDKEEQKFVKLPEKQEEPLDYDSQSENLERNEKKDENIRSRSGRRVKPPDRLSY